MNTQVRATDPSLPLPDDIARARIRASSYFRFWVPMSALLLGLCVLVVAIGALALLDLLRVNISLSNWGLALLTLPLLAMVCMFVPILLSWSRRWRGTRRFAARLDQARWVTGTIVAVYSFRGWCVFQVDVEHPAPERFSFTRSIFVGQPKAVGNAALVLHDAADPTLRFANVMAA